MSLTTLLFVVTIVIVFSGAEVLKVLITELLQPAPVLAEEPLAVQPLLLVQVVQPAEAPPAGAPEQGAGAPTARR